MIGGGSASIDGQGFANLIRLGVGWDWGFLGMGDADTFSRALPTAITAGVLLVLGLIAVILVKPHPPTSSPLHGEEALSANRRLAAQRESGRASSLKSCCSG